MIWALVAVVAVETAAIITLLVLWRVAVRRRRALLERVRGERRPRGVLGVTPEGAVKAVWETAALVRDKGVGGALRSSIGDIVRWAEIERPELVQLAGVDGCVAIVFSDIEDSTTLNERLGDRAWIKVLEQHNRLVLKQVERQHGQVVKNQGDGFMIAFAEADQAVRCAMGVQRALDRRPLRPPVQVRVGIHYGSVVHRDNDLFGRNVALAARVASSADGGEVVVSGDVVDALADIDELDARLTDLRAIPLKGLTGDQVVATLDWRD